MRSRVIILAAFTLALAVRPAAADDLRKVTIAFAGKGMSFLLQYIAIGAGYYKEEGLDPDSSMSPPAPAGGGGDGRQRRDHPARLAHTMQAVARGGTLVAIGTGFDEYPDRAGALQRCDQAIGHHAIRCRSTRRSSGCTACASASPRRAPAPTSSCARSCWCAAWIRRTDVQLQPIGIGAPMVAAMEAGGTDGFAFMSPFTDIAVSRGHGQVIADPMQDNCPSTTTCRTR